MCECTHTSVLGTWWRSVKVLAKHLLGLCSRLLKPLVKFSLPTGFNYPSEQGVGEFEGGISLLALQPVAYPSRSCMGGEGLGRLVNKYTWSIGCCATWCNTRVPLSCCSLVAFKLLKGLFVLLRGSAKGSWWLKCLE